MKEESKKVYSQRTLIIISAIIVLCIGLWLLFTELWSECQTMFYYQAQIKEAKEELEIQKNKLANIQKVFERIHSQRERLKRLSLSLPSQVNYNQVLGEIVGISEMTGSEITSASFQEEKVVFEKEKKTEEKESILKPYSVISLGLSGKGRYQGLKDFVRFLENDIRLMDIEELRISKKESGVDPLLSFEMKIHFYQQEE